MSFLNSLEGMYSRSEQYTLTVEMIPKHQVEEFETNLECPVCMALLKPTDDHEGAQECNECEKGICKRCVTRISICDQICPCCRQKSGFRAKLSKLRKKELEELEFKCPNYNECEQQLKYLEAEKHINVCAEQKRKCDKERCGVNDKILQDLTSLKNQFVQVVKENSTYRRLIENSKDELFNKQQKIEKLEFQVEDYKTKLDNQKILHSMIDSADQNSWRSDLVAKVE